MRLSAASHLLLLCSVDLVYINGESAAFNFELAEEASGRQDGEGQETQRRRGRRGEGRKTQC